MALERLTRSNDDAVASKGPGGGLKFLVVIFILLDLAAAGFYGYLILVKRDELEGQRTQAYQALLQVSRDSQRIATAVSDLARASTVDVNDPSSPIYAVGNSMPIGEGQTMTDNFTVKPASPRAFQGNNNFMVHSVTIDWVNKEGYRFQDLVRFHESVESKNPKVQIKSIDFGKCDLNTEDKWWRPSQTKVRVFKPRPDRSR